MKDRKIDVITMGLCSVDVSVLGADFGEFFKNEMTRASRITLCVGGDAINQSTTLSRLGHKVHFMGNVGDDDAGKCVLSSLGSNGVDVSSVVVREGVPTSTVVLMVGDKDDRHMCPSTAESTNRYFDIDVVDFDLFRNAKIVSYGSLFCFPLISDEKLTEILRKAKEAGCITFADNKLDLTSNYDRYRNAMHYLDYLFVNQDEAQFYSGEDNPEKIAAYFMGLGVKNVIVKLGGKGCFVTSGSEKYYLSTYDVELVDTNGAGDNFAAGFISATLRGMGLYDRAKFATATAGMTVSSLGSSTGVRSMKAVEDFMASHELKPLK